MKSFLFVIACILTGSSLFAQQQKQMPPKADSLYKHLMAAIRPSISSWVKTTAAKYAGKELTQEQAISEVKHAPALGSLADGDIMAIAFLVMMDASKSAQDDIKSIMNNVKATNDAKAQQRQQMANVQVKPGNLKIDSPRNASRTNDNKMVIANNNTKDNLSEMSDPNQLKLRLYTERRNKMMDAISNLLKKIADTEQQITQNLK